MSNIEPTKENKAKQKFDGMIEAVRYRPDGQVELVRFYERRGPTFSDHLLINRNQLIQRLKKGKKFVIGTRIPYLASTFSVSNSLQLVKSGNDYILSTTGSSVASDTLEDAPLF